MLDFAYFFYTCAPKSLLDQIDKFLEIYHESLSSFMKELGSDPEKIFPLSDLKEHWRKYSLFGMVMANTLLRFLLREEDEEVSITDEGFANAKNEKGGVV